MYVCVLWCSGAPAKAITRYASAAAAIGSLERLRSLHYDAASGTFRDYGLHTDEVQLVWRDVAVPEGQPPKVRNSGLVPASLSVLFTTVQSS